MRPLLVGAPEVAGHGVGDQRRPQSENRKRAKPRLVHHPHIANYLEWLNDYLAYEVMRLFAREPDKVAELPTGGMWGHVYVKKDVPPWVRRRTSPRMPSRTGNATAA